MSNNDKNSIDKHLHNPTFEWAFLHPKHWGRGWAFYLPPCWPLFHTAGAIAWRENCLYLWYAKMVVLSVVHE